MKAFNSWVNRKPEPSAAVSASAGESGFLRERLMGKTAEATPEPANWETVESTEELAPAPAPMPEPEAHPIHDGRTRLLGFEKSDGTSTDVFSNAPDVSANESVNPVGWLLVVKGPGRGHCFTLFNGMMQMGRGDDQAIRLNFGDSTISRDNHAAILFDPQDGLFWLGHGGKANIVRVNQKPLISNQSLDDGDEITIGETTLQLRTFCGPHFNWESGPTEEEEMQNLSLG